MKEATVCHLLQENCSGTKILLGQRQSHFCGGIWNGPGGKFNKNEGILGCVKREVQEEIKVEIDLSSARHYATLSVYQPTLLGQELEWRVYFLSATSWKGEPQLTKAFKKLKWFPKNNLPWKKMMIDQVIWLPLALTNKDPKKILEVDIYWADVNLNIVEKGSFQFVDRPKGPPRRKP